MIIKVTMKCPDALDDGVREAVDSLENLPTWEKEALQEETRDIISSWFNYGEYLLVEFDTEKRTATVLEP